MLGCYITPGTLTWGMEKIIGALDKTLELRFLKQSTSDWCADSQDTRRLLAMTADVKPGIPASFAVTV